MTISFDGKASGTATSAATVSALLTTTKPNDIIIAVVDVHSANSAIGVSSVDGGGLTWTRRSTQNYAVPNFPPNHVIHEVWWALATGPLTALSITALFNNFSGTSYEALNIFAVNGANLTAPFDPNVSLPASIKSALSDHSITGISTTNPNTFGFAMIADDNLNHTYTADAGYTLIASLTGTSGAFLGAASEYKIQSGALSGVTINPFSGQATSAYIAQVDAIQGVVLYNLGADGLTAPPPELAAPGLSQIHPALAADLIAASPSLASPALIQSHAISADALTAPSPDLGAPVLVQAQALTATALTTPAPLLDSPALLTASTVLAAPLTAPAPLLGSPALTQRRATDAANLSAPSPLLARPALTVVVTINLTNLLVERPAFGPAALRQRHRLLATGLRAAPWRYAFRPTIERRIIGDRDPARIDGRADFNRIEGSP